MCMKSHVWGRIVLKIDTKVPENAKARVCAGGKTAETKPLASLQVS